VVGVASKGSRGEGGFVDVWKRGCFAWEYRRKDRYKNLDEAYRYYRDNTAKIEEAIAAETVSHHRRQCG